jgi:hypothetical protein
MQHKNHHRFAAFAARAGMVLPLLLALTLALTLAALSSPPVTAQEIQSVLVGPILNAQGEAIDADPSGLANLTDLTDLTDLTELRVASRPNDPFDETDDAPAKEPERVDAGEDIDALITKIVLDNIPHEFKEDQDWGAQESRWNGVDIRRDGLKLRTHRKKKMVNHGTWKKYDVSLLNPEDQFSISVKNMREAEDGKMAFDVHVAANLKIDGRQAKWLKGVQLYNVSIDGKTKVNLKATIELRTLMNMTKFPPDLVFRPEATAVHISVEDFRIDRISKVGGEVTQQITRLARGAIESRLEKEESKTVKKLNAEFAKNADKLKLSLHEAMSNKWSAAAKKFMPADVKKALAE